MTDETDAPAVPSRKRRGWVKSICFRLLAVFLILVLIEGFASLGMFVYDIFAYGRRPLAERNYTQYDEQLGWVSTPDTVVEDLYGPGRTVTINKQSLRATQEFAKEVPPGKTRVLCTGDSFTFGYGVGDGDSWCSQLDRLAPQFEVLNMGQGGYGFDQSFLWYQRDGFNLPHDVHLVALGIVQLDRMSYDSFLGYGKPTLKLESNRLVADHVPVPRRAFHVPWLTQNTELLKSCRTIRLATRISGAQSRNPTPVMDSSKVGMLLMRAIEAMQAVDRQQGCQLVVVWLPRMEECLSPESDSMRSGLLGEIRQKGVPIIDLVDQFRTLRPEVIRGLYIRDDDPHVDFPGAAGHYTVEGNRFVAERLMVDLPRLLAPSDSHN